MKTAEEILNHEIECADASEQNMEIYKRAINIGRKETIEEIANKTYIDDNNFHPVITKEEILSIINELK